MAKKKTKQKLITPRASASGQQLESHLLPVGMGIAKWIQKKLPSLFIKSNIHPPCGSEITLIDSKEMGVNIQIKTWTQMSTQQRHSESLQLETRQCPRTDKTGASAQQDVTDGLTWSVQWHGWVLHPLHWGKEAQYRRLQIVWFHLHGILEKTIA